VPGEDPFQDGAEDETKAASWVRTPNARPRPPATSAMPRKMVKGLDISMLLGAGCGVFEMAVAAGDEDQADHEAHEEQAKDSEAG
jgi:hypothetical protein